MSRTLSERTLELVVKGVGIGDAIPLQLKLPEGAALCGRPFVVSLVFERPFIPTPDIAFMVGREMGLGCEVIDLISPRESDDGRSAELKIALTMHWPPGRTVLEIVLKEATYGATVGLLRTELDLLPPAINVVFPETYLVIDRSDGMRTEIVLRQEGTEKVKGELSFELRDSGGTIVPLQAETRKRFSMKGELKLPLDITPASPLRDGSYHLEVVVLHEGIRTRYKSGDMSLATKGSTEDMGPGQLEDGVKANPSVLVKNLEASPRSVFPGETVTVSLECSLPEGMKEVARTVLRIGNTDAVELELPVLDSNGMARATFVLPTSISEGDAPCELLIIVNDMTVHRDVRPRFITVRRSSELEMIIRTPLDLYGPDAEPGDALLLPGERYSGVETMGGLKVISLNTGRHLLELDSSIVGSKDGMDPLIERARGLFVLHCFRRSTIESGMHRELTISLEREKRFLKRLVEAREVPSRVRGPLDNAKTGWTFSVLECYQRGIIGKDGGWTDSSPVRKLFQILEGLFQGSNSGEHPSDPMKALHSFAEDTVNALKQAGARPGREALSKALSMLAARSEASLLALKAGKGEKDLIAAAKDLIGSLMLSSVVRLEALSAWDDPAVNAWEDLRTERVRAIKHEVGTLLEIPSRLISMTSSARLRFDACMRNMKARRTLRLVRSIGRLPRSITLSGTGGAIWEGRMELSLEHPSATLRSRVLLSLPDPSWQLISPPSERVGEALDLGRMEVSNGSPMEIHLRVQAPQLPSRKQTSLIYLIPEGLVLEEEP